LYVDARGSSVKIISSGQPAGKNCQNIKLVHVECGFQWTGTHDQLVPSQPVLRTTRTHYQPVPKSICTHDYSYPRQFVPMTNSYPSPSRTHDQLVPKTFRTQENSYPVHYILGYENAKRSRYSKIKTLHATQVAYRRIPTEQLNTNSSAQIHQFLSCLHLQRLFYLSTRKVELRCIATWRQSNIVSVVLGFNYTAHNAATYIFNTSATAFVIIRRPPCPVKPQSLIYFWLWDAARAGRFDTFCRPKLPWAKMKLRFLRDDGTKSLF